LQTTTGDKMTLAKLPEDVIEFLIDIGLTIPEIDVYESLQDAEGKMTLIRCVRKLDTEGIDVTDVDAEEIVEIATKIVKRRLEDF
jgi:hypothetical protein